MPVLLFIAWTGLGHRIVAETAALLVQHEPGALLQRHRFELGVYAALPDSVFRKHDAAEGSLHFLDLDRQPLTAWLKGPVPPPEEGRVPWRIAQLVTLARIEWGQVKRVTGGWETGGTAAADNAHVFRALFYMGVLAHYTGDSAVPHHAVSDRNGFAQGQGGVHFFFEGNCVNALEPALAPAALQLARSKRDDWLRQWQRVGDSELALALALLDDSAKRAPAVEAADKPFVVKPSQGEVLAQRKPATLACPTQRELIVERLAKGAVLTAELWRRTLAPGLDWSTSQTLQLSDLVDDVSSVPFP